MAKSAAKSTLLKEAFMATSILITTVILINTIAFKFEVIRPVKQEFDDFDIYDLFFAGKDTTHTGVLDSNIVVVQAADSRMEIAKQINQLKSLHPAVIGVDVVFSSEREPMEDSILRQSVADSNTIVPGYSLQRGPENEPVIYGDILPHEYLVTNGSYINFPYADESSVIRSFAPFITDKKQIYTAFSVKVVEKFDPEKLVELKKRKNDVEVINFYGNNEYFLCYTAGEFENSFIQDTVNIFKDKIVLLGYFADKKDPTGRREDLLFSPMNKQLTGKGSPDIYGVIIHANIISMILKGNDYISSPRDWLSFLIAFVLTFFLIYFVLHSYKKYRHPYHIKFLVLQLIYILVIVYLFLLLYQCCNIKVNLLPIVFALVLSVELFDLYKMIASFLNKKFSYTTIFSSQ